MAESTETTGIHTVAISKTAATILVGCSVVAVGAFSSSYWNLANSNAVLVEQVSQLRKFAERGDRCTAETCQNTRAALERLRNEVMQHEREAQSWIRRIITCEYKVEDCVACQMKFGVKKDGR